MNYMKENGKLKIGKPFGIHVEEGKIIDADYLNQIKNKEINSQFDLLAPDVLSDLINYMTENDCVIVAGEYNLNQAWTLDQVISEFTFKTKGN